MNSRNIKKTCQCLVLLPAGPEVPPAHVEDTIESINHYIGTERCVIAVIDDTGCNRYRFLKDCFSNTETFTATNYTSDRKLLPFAKLFAKQIRVMKTLANWYDFDVLLKIDTDALVIGPRPQEDAIAFFQANPDVGIVGSFLRRGDGSDKMAAMQAKGRIFEQSLKPSRRNYHLRFLYTVRRLDALARRNGYQRGYTCTGGAYFISKSMLDTFAKKGFFNLEILRFGTIGEDSTMGLLAYAAGFRLADLPHDRDVLAINWRGLPMPLDQLLARGKKIVHPIKLDDPAAEAQIRAFFRARRISELQGQLAG